ncbi:hypothetical protein [Nonomuraea rhodomycinica]|uniref:Lipoprotein n=1 Tax=Nonomuraea rhodomycinica TaxID=1712872 RepID=A0A7Y6IY05_9ACTN|nr:hypothetical protein [Nonomuraea rhodomycinica]NUW46512.1 hypothetical protein [Nonomuraea rhodomycinica]
MVNRLGWALAAVSALLTAGCARQAHWYPIESAAVSTGGRTITAMIITGRPGPDGRFCVRVTDTEMSETSEQVVLGIEVRDDCESIFPWEGGGVSTNFGFPRTYQFHLKEPLSRRRLVDQATRQEIAIL